MERTEVKLYDAFEVSLPATITSENPFAVLPRARFMHEDGMKYDVCAFYDGGEVFKLRFMPDRVGLWRYEVEQVEGVRFATSPERQTPCGQIVCTSSSLCGPLKISPEGKHFMYSNGEIPFILGNTAYNLIATYMRSPDEAREFIQYYAQRRFNWVRFFLEQTTWDSHGLVVWPFGGRAPQAVMDPANPERPLERSGSGSHQGSADLSVYDLATFQAAEAVIRELGVAGCTASVILLHACDFRPLKSPALLGYLKAYIRYAVARLGAYYNVVWNLANEWEREHVLSAADVDALGECLKQEDPYSRLVAVHHYGRFEFPDRDWCDISSMQYRGLPHEIHRNAKANRAFGKPVLNEEYGYEGDNHSPPNDPVNVRRDHWALTMAGAYGTYGDKTKGPKVGAYFSSTLSDSVDAVVPDALGHMSELMERAPYWRMKPLDELVHGCIPEQVFCLAEPGREYLVYLTVGQDFGLDLTHVSSGSLVCCWWNPRTGEVLPPEKRSRLERKSKSPDMSSLDQPVWFRPPDYVNDWVLHVKVAH